MPIALSAPSRATSSLEQGIVESRTTSASSYPTSTSPQFSAGHTSSANAVHPRHRAAGPPDHDRPRSLRLRRRRLPRPPGGPELEPHQPRAHRGPARPAGHAVRPQLDRRRDQSSSRRRPVRRSPAPRVGLESAVPAARLNGDFYGDYARQCDAVAVSFTGGFKNRDGLGDFPQPAQRGHSKSAR